MQRKSPEDDFDLGFHDAPDEITVRALSYVRLCAEITETKPETVKFMLLEAEKRRRDSAQSAEPAKPEPNHATYEAGKPKHAPTPQDPQWWQKPLGIVGIGVCVALLGALLNHLLRTHLGLSP